MEEKINRLMKLERVFSVNEYEGIGDKDFIYIKGEIPIIISAPHAVKQNTARKEKIADMCTGGLALLLNELTSCHVIAKSRNDGIDPNRSNEDDEYKKKLVNIIKEDNIKLLIDLHGLNEDRKTDIDIITHYGKTIDCKNHIVEHFKRHFKDNNIINLSQDKYFSAKSEKVIVHYIWNKLMLPSVELEINFNYRDFNKPNNLIDLINALENIILKYNY